MDNGFPVPDGAIELLKQASTGMVNDALAMLGIQGSVLGPRPARGFEDTRIVGPAATLFLAPPHPDTPPVSMYTAVRSLPAGSVVVIDAGGGEENFTGDNQGEAAMRHGLVGVVVNGGARDVAGFRAIGMPLFITGAATRIGRVQVTGINVPVEIGGVTIRPGDMIVADEDGVVSIPASKLPEVLANLKETIFAIEKAMEEALKRDAPDAEIMAILARKKPKK